MMPLAPADRAKLARGLALLGSPHTGELAAAAAAADRLVRGRGLDWADVLNQNDATCARLHQDPAAIAAFVTNLAKTSYRRFSMKQRSILADIAVKARSARPRGT